MTLEDLSDVFSISILTQGELAKRQYYRPVYSVHKWWARRPGSLFRAILLSLLVEGRLFEIDNGFPDVRRSNYFRPQQSKDVVVLDPFMGGGTTLVEANRLGLRTIGADINPVSFVIVRETLKKIDTERLQSYFKLLDSEVGDKIGRMYRTSCARCGQPSGILYTFWVRKISCPVCKNTIRLFKHYYLNYGRKRGGKGISTKNPATVVCPSCGSLNETPSDALAKCKFCKLEFDPRVGTFDKGLFDCPHCGTKKISLPDTIKHVGGILGAEPVAIEYDCKTCGNRLYKNLDKDDHLLLEKINQIFTTRKAELLIPNEQIPLGDSSARLINHGFTSYAKLFNERQLLAFNEIIRGIGKVVDDIQYREGFYLVLSNCLEYNNMMSPFNYPHRKLHHLFNYHALAVTTMPVEVNVWGSLNDGSGTFINCYNRFLNAKRYCNEPFDRLKDPQGRIVTVRNGLIEGNFVESFDDVKRKERATMLLLRNSTSLPDIPTGSVDYVVTDPPYYNNIHYSELSNFFFVWLRRLFSYLPPQLELVKAEEEAIVNRLMRKDDGFYQKMLTSVFKECNRVLKPDGQLVFTFHHTNPKAWYHVYASLVRASFSVASYFPVFSEYRVSPHIRNKKTGSIDLVLLCRTISDKERQHSVTGIETEFKHQLEERRSSIVKLAEVFGRDIVFYGEIMKILTKNTDQLLSYDDFHDVLLQLRQYLNYLPEKMTHIRYIGTSKSSARQVVLTDFNR